MARSRSHDVFLYATQYGYSVGSTLIEDKSFEIFLGLDVRDGNKVALLLLESNDDACCLSLSPRRRKGGVRTGRRR